MLRFDPVEDRIRSARTFRVWEGGGEYNVARAIAKNFKLRASMLTALADNEIGRLVEGLMREAEVSVEHILWRETDGISRSVRNGMYFMEKGFGCRPPLGCSDRGNTAISKLRPGDIDWDSLFKSGVRWFHTGGIFAALSETTGAVASEAMRTARANGTIVSYDLNYRGSLWADRGGREAADELNHQLLEHSDVVFGLPGFDSEMQRYSEAEFVAASEGLRDIHPNLSVIATTLRSVFSASRHSLSGVCFFAGNAYKAMDLWDLEVLDRVGSGDAFAAGLIYGILSGTSMKTAISLGVASGALALSTAGDGSAATFPEIADLASGRPRIQDR